MFSQILVKFKARTNALIQAEIFACVGASPISIIQRIDVHVVEVDQKKVQQVLADLQRDPRVEFAEMNRSVELAFAPNDTSFGSQWGMAKINASTAWDTTQSDSSIRIAILDTGIDLDHPDLAAKIMVSQDFTGSPVGADDSYNHGTHVAGTAAAITNNSLGIAGVGFNASILNAKVVNDAGTGSVATVANGIAWAVTNGANVINISWVTTLPSSTLQTAINDAWNAGVVIVGAAGNNGNNAFTYPASYANVIAVAATDTDDTMWSSSTYGTWVDVAAPGVSIYSTVVGGGYGSGTGTSFAAPHVAGLAALLVWIAQDTNGNNFINDEVRAAIEGSAVNINVINPFRPIGGGRIDAAAAVASLGGPYVASKGIYFASRMAKIGFF